MPIDPSLDRGVFEPKAIAAMGEAFDTACEALRFRTAGFQRAVGDFCVVLLVVKSTLAGTPGCRPRVGNILRLQLANRSGELVEALPRLGESERGRLEPLGRSASRGGRCGQPGKVWGPASYRLSRFATVGLPSYTRGKPNNKNHQDAGEGK
jgi:hypothetical protein